MKKMLILLVAAPVLALLGGVGLLALSIGQTWTSTNTQSLITGLSAVCGGGVVVIALFLALIVGVPLAIRAYGEAGKARRNWDYDDLPMPGMPGPVMDGAWRSLPGPGDMPPVPPWQVTGGGQLDLLPQFDQDERFTVEGTSRR